MNNAEQPRLRVCKIMNYRLLISLALCISWAQAQAQNEVLEEIIVTAQKREQSAQDIPISIVALSKKDMAYYSLGSSNDIDNLVPNMVINGAYPDSSPKVQIRGVGTDDFTLVYQSAVGLYVDEVYLGSPVGSTNSLFDLERIEVLRGPQGTLYGRNTTGGAVNFVSRRPGDHFATDGKISFGNFDALTAEAGIDMPLVQDKLHTRFAILYRTRDGSTLNRFNGKKVNGVDATAGRLTLDFFPNDRVSARLVMSALFNRGDGAQAQHVNGSFPGGTDAFGYTDPDGKIDYAGDYDYPGREYVDHYGITGFLDWDLGGITFKSITAYRNVELDRQENPDANPLVLFQVKWLADFRQFSQEFRLHSDTSKRFRGIGGAYYYTDDLKGQSYAITNAFGGAINWNNGLKVTSYALFTNLEFDLTDQWSLTGGLRWTTEERKNSYLNQFRAATDPSRADLGSITGPVLFPFVPLTQDRRDWDAFSGKIGIDYKFNKDAMVFASYSRGFKSGGFNGFTFSQAGLEPFDPEYINAYEFGLKSTWIDGRFQVNATGYYYDIKDFQVTALLQTGSVPVTTVTNASGATNKGYELEFRALPTAGLDLGLGIGYIDSKIDPFEVSEGRVLTGARMVSSPKWNLNGRAAFTRRLGSGAEVMVGTDFSYTSDLFFDVDPAEASRYVGDDHFLLNGRIRYAFSNSRYAIALWGKNLTDKKYVAYGYSNQDFGHDGVILNTPRTYGIELTFNID